MQAAPINLPSWECEKLWLRIKHGQFLVPFWMLDDYEASEIRILRNLPSEQNVVLISGERERERALALGLESRMRVLVRKVEWVLVEISSGVISFSDYILLGCRK